MQMIVSPAVESASRIGLVQVGQESSNGIFHSQRQRRGTNHRVTEDTETKGFTTKDTKDTKRKTRQTIGRHSSWFFSSFRVFRVFRGSPR
jgi:hypothetical protein